ncbi:MAG TPA: toxin TcdB middle/N-terminal domain-containing protein [Polyangiaceae bacterium]|nr:toxin TcdB middle/N-terminal domain-containing protein [Polyangiaceae bacterium]
MEGLGRSFVPSLASGTASYGVDIAVPPAVGGFAPKLGFEYDGGSGVSELGLGWHLGGLPSIRRRVEDGLPRFDATDTFELTGLGTVSELLEMPDGKFRPQYESGGFVRVQRSSDETGWEARTKAGVTYRFGGAGCAEDEAGNVATYLLCEQEDLHGHVIHYTWDTSAGAALLTSVVWADSGPSARQQLTLAYDERPDVHESFASGIERTLTRRLSSVEVRYGGELVRRYGLTYAKGSPSLLAAIDMVGSDGVTALPRLSFDYTAAKLTADGNVVTMTSPPGRSPGDPNVTFADLNGDGLPDLLVAESGHFRSYVNANGVAWSKPQDWNTSPSVSFGSVGAQLADLDGDGAIDLVEKSGTDVFRYLSGKDATHFGDAVAIHTVPTFTFEDPDVRLSDMDGDRRADAVITTEAGVAIGYNLGGSDFTEPALVGKVDPTEPLAFSDGHTSLCDVNGDRVQDLCTLRSGGLVYWLGRGRGRFEDAQSAEGVPEYDPSDPWKLVDLNGDGWIDLVRVGVGRVDFALAKGAGQFGDPGAIVSTPNKGPHTTVEFADMNGSGTVDVVWVDVSGDGATSYRYLELFPDGRAGLLRQIDNGLGKVTRISYEPAANSAARALAAGKPWTTRLNLAMPVVSRVEVDSSLDDPLLATEYAYRDGAWDPTERTFAGFGGGTETDLGDDSTPTLIRESTFDAGLVHRVLRGSPLTEETRIAQGAVFSRTTSTYTAVSLADSKDGRTVDYGYRTREQVEQLEGQAAPQARTLLSEWAEDAFGNVVEERHWGEVDGTNYGIGDDESVIVRTFSNDEDDWILGRVATEELRDAAGTRVTSKRFYYDGDPFRGLPLGQVSRGDLVRTASWIEGDTFADEERSAYDTNGNVTTVLNLRGGRQEYVYDTETSTFVTKERRFVRDDYALEWTTDYDARFGVLQAVTMPGGARSSFHYDALGRLESIVKPGDTDALPTTHYVYALGDPLSRVTTEQRSTSGKPDVTTTISISDGLSRTRGTLVRASGNQWALSGFTRFDARGNAAFAAFPTFASVDALPSKSPSEGTSVQHDALGRELVTTALDGSTRRTAYAPLSKTVWDENDNDATSPHHDTPTRYENDGLGRLRSVVERDGAREVRTTYDYDPAGKLVRFTDAAGTAHRYEYDGRSRRTLVDDPNAGRWRFFYSTANDVDHRVDPAGNAVRYVYDPIGRITDEWHRGAQDAAERHAVAYHYDAASGEHDELDVNLPGNLAWVEDEAGKIFFGYDARGRETERVRRWLDGTEHVTTSRFDAADRVAARGFPDGSSVDQTYDARGLLANIGPFATDFHWEAGGELTSVHLGNGITEEHSYDARRRLVRLHATSATGAALRDLRYTLDAASRIADVLDARVNIPAPESLTSHFTFDDRYRLVRTATQSGFTQFVYDDAGHLTSTRSDGAPEVVNRFEDPAHAPDRLVHHGDESLTYDDAGRVLSDGARTLTWDAKGRLSRVDNAGTVEEYTYAFDDTRAAKRTTHDGVTTTTRYIAKDVEERDGQLVRYVLSGDERIARLDPLPDESAAARIQTRTRRTSDWVMLCAGLAALLTVALARSPRRSLRLLPAFVALAFAVVPGCEPRGHAGAPTQHPQHKVVSAVPPGAVFYLSDVAHSPVAIVDNDGKTVSTESYAAYGAVTSSTGPQTDPHRFVGNEHDVATGLADFHARPYRADLGIFLAPDPVPLFTPERLLDTPSRLYPYAYAGGDPINRSDPSGLTPREWLSGFWDEGKRAAAEVAHGVAELARVETRQILDGRVADYIATNLVVTAASFTAPVTLAKDVAHLGSDVSASLSAESDYEAGRKAFKPVCTVMSVTATVLGARVGPRPVLGAASSVAGKGVAVLSADAIRFSQSSVNGVGAIAESMAAKGWVGAPIDVVRMQSGLVSVDNTRLLAASMTDTPVRALIHDAGDAIPPIMARRFDNATTWGEAVQSRIGDQNAIYRTQYPEGSWATGVSNP